MYTYDHTIVSYACDSQTVRDTQRRPGGGIRGGRQLAGTRRAAQEDANPELLRQAVLRETGEHAAHSEATDRGGGEGEPGAEGGSLTAGGSEG